MSASSAHFMSAVHRYKQQYSDASFSYLYTNKSVQVTYPARVFSFSNLQYFRKCHNVKSITKISEREIIVNFVSPHLSQYQRLFSTMHRFDMMMNRAKRLDAEVFAEYEEERNLFNAQH